MNPLKRKIDESVDEAIEGVQLEYKDGVVVGLSTKDTLDSQRWRASMPSLAGLPALTRIDLHKNRYILQIDDSITKLSLLKTIKLSQCSRLQELPTEIGALTQLEVVREHSLIK